jgi:hypothetical protein
MQRLPGMAVFLAAAAGLFAGCEDGGGDGGGSGSGSFAGTWALYAGSTVQVNPEWYVHFNSDGTFSISDNADRSGRRVSGTYTVSDGQAVGPFTNPGVGEGRVEARIEGETLRLDFIEYWHSPHKVVPYTGTKI